MICPICRKSCVKGIIEASDSGRLFDMGGRLSWYPESEEDKFFLDNEISLEAYSTAYYCSRCGKIYATFNVY